jgi:hypothetical protein
MVKEKLVFHTNTSGTKKKPQQQQQSTQQSKKTTVKSEPSQGQNGNVLHKNVEQVKPLSISQNDEVVVSESLPTAEDPIKIEQVEGPNTLLRNLVRNLKKKSIKYKKLEEDIKTEMEFNSSNMKKKSKKSKGDGALLTKEEEEQQKQEENKRQQEAQRRQQQLIDTLACVETAQSSLDMLETLQASFTKYYQEKENTIKKLEENVNALTKELNRKTKQLDEQTNTLRELDTQLMVKSNQNTKLDKETNELKSTIQQLEQQLSTFKSIQIGHLTQINELKQQLSADSNQRDQQLQQQSQKTAQLERSLHDNQIQLQQIRQQLQLKEAEANAYLLEQQKKSAELIELQKTLKERDTAIKDTQSRHKEEIDQIKRAKEEELTNKQLELSRCMQQLITARDHAKYLEQERNNAQAEKDRLQQMFQRQQQEFEYKITELTQKVNDQPPIFPVKFEEDILLEIAMRSELSKDEVKLKRLIKLVQVIDFFDLAKPDGLDVRNMFLSDQAALRREGKHVLIASNTDLEAFDHFSRSIRGAQQNIPNREVALIDGVRKLQKLLSNSNEECGIQGVTYQTLSEQITELGSSNVYLTGRTLYPYRDDDTAFSSFTNAAIKTVPNISTQKTDVEPTYVITSASPSKKQHEANNAIEPPQQENNREHTSYDFNLRYNVQVTPSISTSGTSTEQPQPQQASPKQHIVGFGSWTSSSSIKQPSRSWADESIHSGTMEQTLEKVEEDSSKNYQPRKQYRGPRRGKGSSTSNRGGNTDRGSFRGGFRGRGSRKSYVQQQSNDTSSISNDAPKEI